jgi:DNA (cytosine-5)-methyltransferase 1
VIIADDLFAGAGGWDLAARWLGIRARGVENMAAARATRDAAGLETIHDDVWTFCPDGAARLKISSPPCQTFSQSGSGSGRKAMNDVLSLIPFVGDMTLAQLKAAGQHLGDDRTALVLTPLWFALHHDHYQEIAWEQVRTVQPVWDACAAELRIHGWYVWTGKVYAEQHGVPQARTRSALLGSRVHPVEAPVPTHSRYYPHKPSKLDEGVPRWLTMAEALGRGMTMAEALGRGMTHRPSMTVTGGGTSTGGAEPFGNAARQGMRREIDAGRWMLKSRRDSTSWVDKHGTRENRTIDQPAPTITGESHRWAWMPIPAIEGERSEDIAWPYDRPSPTIVGTFAPDVVAAPGYRKAGDPPRQKTPGSVRITIQEAAVLQSFPADYPWRGNEGKQYLQVGNAVPPLLAMALLSALYPELAALRGS